MSVSRRKYLKYLAGAAIAAGAAAGGYAAGYYMRPPPAGRTKLKFQTLRYIPSEHYMQLMETDPWVTDRYTVMTELLPADVYVTKALLILSSGSSEYDFMCHFSHTLGQAAPFLEPLNELVEKYRVEYNLDGIPQAIWDACTIDGEILQVPFSLLCHLFYYRKDLMDYPETWDKWISEVERVTAGDFYGFSIAGARPQLHEYVWNCLQSHGQEYFDEDMKPIMNGPNGVRAMENLVKLTDNAPEGWPTYSNTEVLVGIQEAKVATTINWFTRCKMVDDPDASKVIGNVEFDALPGDSVSGSLGSPMSYVGGFDIPKASKNKEETFELLCWLVNEANQTYITENGIDAPIRPDAITPKAIEGVRWLKAHQKQLPTSVPSPKFPEFSSISQDIISPIAVDVLLHKTTPKEGLDHIAQKTYDVLKDAGYYT